MLPKELGTNRKHEHLIFNESCAPPLNFSNYTRQPINASSIAPRKSYRKCRVVSVEKDIPTEATLKQQWSYRQQQKALLNGIIRQSKEQNQKRESRKEYNKMSMEVARQQAAEVIKKSTLLDGSSMDIFYEHSMIRSQPYGSSLTVDQRPQHNEQSSHKQYSQMHRPWTLANQQRTISRTEQITSTINQEHRHSPKSVTSTSKPAESVTTTPQPVAAMLNINCTSISQVPVSSHCLLTQGLLDSTLPMSHSPGSSQRSSPRKHKDSTFVPQLSSTSHSLKQNRQLDVDEASRWYHQQQEAQRSATVFQKQLAELQQRSQKEPGRRFINIGVNGIAEKGQYSDAKLLSHQPATEPLRLPGGLSGSLLRTTVISTGKGIVSAFGQPVDLSEDKKATVWPIIKIDMPHNPFEIKVIREPVCQPVSEEFIRPSRTYELNPIRIDSKDKFLSLPPEIQEAMINSIKGCPTTAELHQMTCLTGKHGETESKALKQETLPQLTKLEKRKNTDGVLTEREAHLEYSRFADQSQQSLSKPLKFSDDEQLKKEFSTANVDTMAFLMDLQKQLQEKQLENYEQQLKAEGKDSTQRFESKPEILDGIKSLLFEGSQNLTKTSNACENLPNSTNNNTNLDNGELSTEMKNQSFVLSQDKGITSVFGEGQGDLNEEENDNGTTQNKLIKCSDSYDKETPSEVDRTQNVTEGDSQYNSSLRSSRLDGKDVVPLCKGNSVNSNASLGWSLDERGLTPANPESLEIQRTLIKSFQLFTNNGKSMGMDDSLTPFVESRYLNVYQLIKDPELIEYANLLTDLECDRLLQLAEQVGWVPSKTSIGTENSEQDSYNTVNSNNRTSFTSRISTVNHPIIEMIENRLAQILNISLEYMEYISVVRYEPGQQFKIHHDGDFRLKSLIIYLNDVEEGGETSFPTVGVAVTPKKGYGLLWSNVLSHGTADMRLLHAGLPVVKGMKYCIPIFINKRKSRENSK